ncbi:MAG: hypothetical protein LAT81_10455 [Oceanicaulis sp.]|nr:hypothetical protein [Oceanicaulis sp.]
MDAGRYSWRYGARDPWLAPWPRTALYLIWRALIASVRPVLFMALAAASIALGFLALHEPGAGPSPSHSAETAVPGGSGASYDRRLRAAIPANIAARTLWETEIARALDAGPWRTPDLALAESLALALPAIEGEDALAFSILTENRSAAHVEAELRARPVWVRDQRLQAALDARLSEGAGLEPPWLIFARPELVSRLERARTLYGPARDAAEAGFAAPRGAAIHLPALAGWRGESAVTLFGDARDLAIHGCAAALAAGHRIAACAGVPAGSPDPVLTGLLLFAASVPGEGGAGRRLAAAAYASGHLDRELAQRLALGPDPALGREALMASLTPLLVEAGSVKREPWRYRAGAEGAASEYARAARIDLPQYQSVIDALSAVRRSDGAMAALRTASWIAEPEDAARLIRLAEARSGRLLAFDVLAGAQMLDAAGDPELDRRTPQTPRRAILIVMALVPGALALAMVAAALNGAAKGRRQRRPGALTRLDAAISVLILGRNS